MSIAKNGKIGVKTMGCMEDRDTDKICPILTLGWYSGRDGYNASLRPCLRTHCQWWDENKSQCGILETLRGRNKKENES